jgi:hypothetical protein
LTAPVMILHLSLPIAIIFQMSTPMSIMNIIMIY